MTSFERSHSIRTCLAIHSKKISLDAPAYVMAAFCFVLYVTALGLTNGFADQEQLIRSSWFSVLIADYTLFYIHISGDDERLDFFHALGKSRLYVCTQLTMMLLTSVPVMIFWCAVSIIQNAFVLYCLWQLSIMLLFSAALFLSAMFARVVLQPYRLSRMLYVLISGPCVLVAWLFALEADMACWAHEPVVWPATSLALACAWAALMLRTQLEKS